MEPDGARIERGVHAHQGRERFPRDRDLVVVDREDRRRVAHEGQDRLALEAHEAVGQDGLVLAGRVDPEQVLAGHVGGGEDPHEARMPCVERTEVADREPGVVVGRADGTQQEHAGVVEVVAEALGPGDLLDAVGAGDPRPDRVAHRGLVGRGGGARPDAPDGVDDRGVAGAPAQDPAEPVEHLGIGRRRRAGDEVVGGHEHPGRARAALGAAAGEERRLERRERAGGPEALDRLDAPSLGLARRDEARARLLAVDPDRAGAAVAGVAADLGARQPEVLAQDVDETPAPVGVDLDGAAVDGQSHPRRGAGRRHAATSASARRTIVRTASER